MVINFKMGCTIDHYHSYCLILDVFHFTVSVSIWIFSCVYLLPLNYLDDL